jgi:PAS domain S-box-containing protein
MNNSEKTNSEFGDLRKRAERALSEKGLQVSGLSLDEAQDLIHDLHVHQIELELQNEELRRAQNELAVSRRRYIDLYDFAPAGYFTFSTSGLITRANLTLADMLGVQRADLLRQPLSDYIVKEDWDAFYNFRGDLLEGNSPKVCEVRMVRADDSTFYARLEGRPIEDGEDENGSWRATVIDITDRRRAELAEHRQRVLAEALRDTAMVFSRTLELDEVLDRVLENVGHVVSHDFSNVMLITSEDEVQAVRSNRIGDDGPVRRIAPLTIPLNDLPILYQMAQTRNPVIIADAARMRPLQSVLPGTFRAYAGVPISLHTKVVGFLNLGAKEPGAFDGMDLDPLEAFAAQAAVAIQNARFHQQAQVLAAIEERERLARDLHDAVSQTLFSTSLIAESLPRVWDKRPEEVAPRLAQLHRLTRGAMAEMRSLLMELRPERLLKADFVDLLKQLGDAGVSRAELEIDVKADPDIELPIEVKVAFYYIAHEAINNAIKHARASHIDVRFREEEDDMILSIVDDGCGFDKETTEAGQGLVNMRERANAVDAELRLESSPGEGTQIIISWSQGAEHEESPKDKGDVG